VTGMRQAQTKLPVIGQEKQSLTVVVEPAHRVKTAPFLGQQITHSASIRRVAAGTEATARLVQGDVEFAFDFDRRAVHRDAVARRVHLRSQYLYDLAVDRDVPGQDEFLAGTTRSDAGFRKEFLQANHGGADFGVWTSESRNELEHLVTLKGLLVLFRTPHSIQASGLVLRRPMTRSPSFHCQRFLNSVARSKRFKTLRLAPVVPTARRLRCCDIDALKSYVG